MVIVGIEDPENFRYVSAQKKLFSSVVPDGVKLLFVSRYPQEQSNDLLDWLQSIPNRYIHFGDLDLAGIHIYLTSFYSYLGERASFLIPADYEHRIALGSRERYNDQLKRYGSMQVTDSRLKELVACIHQYHRGYDQGGVYREGIILSFFRILSQQRLIHFFGFVGQDFSELVEHPLV